MKLVFELLTMDQVRKIHDASLAVLARTGMRIGSSKLLEALRKRGAKVDANAQTVLFPEKMVESTIENNRRLLGAGRTLHLLNGVTSEIVAGNRISAKMSGGCEKYFDWETQTIRGASASELLKYLRIGETIPEIAFVGNPIIMRSDLDGRQIDEKLRRIKTAAFIAKNTTKIGSMEVFDEKEIDLLMEIGIVARGDRKRYYQKPCLVTAKETISPLFLDEHSGDILLGFAKRELPCTIIPMPITGISAPVTKLGNAVVGNAEILGVMTAVQSVYPESLVGGGTITGMIDMQTSVVSFSAPEAILQDIAIAEVHQRLYGLNYLIGSGYVDAKYPNSQVLAEKTMKYLLTYLSGRHSYPVGLMYSGSVFSIEQALVDVEICRYIHGHFSDFAHFDAIQDIVDLIDRVGIRGNYIAEDHTLAHFKENWFPGLFDRTSFVSLEESKTKDVYAKAHQRVRTLLSAGDFWKIEPEKAREIDRIVEKASEIL